MGYGGKNISGVRGWTLPFAPCRCGYRQYYPERCLCSYHEAVRSEFCRARPQESEIIPFEETK